MMCHLIQTDIVTRRYAAPMYYSNCSINNTPTRFYCSICKNNNILGGCIVIFSSLNNDEVSWGVDTPCQGCCCDQHLDLSFDIESFYQHPIIISQAGMVNANTELDCVTKIAVLQVQYMIRRTYIDI